MQCFRVVYENTYEPTGECVYEENTSDKWDIA